ncbi:hypothetical protein BLA60_34295 [Actinophytocola xinjiangensis]|uniref:SPW repeat-containing protein n=1 Tax=Actinophytocola xinjiangensis TaxID=485602 RepID=A0A7Z1AVL3_9PSEU|nr:hypothetical protein [Actinophytocola xinjiangensis]OLF05854.1 hypothetical protein BLA60_34295 [Actinophytocola xinjiangensis]
MNYPTARNLTAAGLVGIIVGIVFLRIAGVDMPPVPPGALICLVAAVAMYVAPWKWVPIVAVLGALAEAIPSIVGVGSAEQGGMEVLGDWVRLIGALVALVFAVVATIASFRGAKAEATA